MTLFQWNKLIDPYGDGTDTSRRRLFLRLHETLLLFFGVPWMNFTQTLSCLNCTKNLKWREKCYTYTSETWRTKQNMMHRNVGHLLIRNINFDLVPVSWSCTSAVKFGYNLDQSVTAKQVVTFGCRCSTLKREHVKKSSWLTWCPTHKASSNMSYLSKLEGKEAIVLCAHRNTAEVWQGNAGFHLTCLLISQNQALLGQEENSCRSLKS